MGAWGYYNFDNDTAADFAGNFKDEPGAEVLREALAAVTDEDYLDSDEACEALAAAEIVAAVLGKPGPDFPADLLLVIPRLTIDHIEPLRTPARHAVLAVLRDNSELRELWVESDDYNNWQELQHALLQRLEPHA